jgi:hypothetical protein
LAAASVMVNNALKMNERRSIDSFLRRDRENEYEGGRRGRMRSGSLSEPRIGDSACVQ